MHFFIMIIFDTDLKSKQGRTFHQSVGGKSEEEIWLVDFYAPWLYIFIKIVMMLIVLMIFNRRSPRSILKTKSCRCGPCQELAPEWRALAKLTQSIPFVHVGKVQVLSCYWDESLCTLKGDSSRMHQNWWYMDLNGQEWPQEEFQHYLRSIALSNRISATKWVCLVIPPSECIQGAAKVFALLSLMYFFDGIAAGANRYQPYPGNRRDVTSLHAWLQVTKTSILFGKVEILEPQFNVFLPQEQIPSAVENITPFTFKHRF